MKASTKNPRVVQCANLIERDFDEAPEHTVIVCTHLASNFRVERLERGRYLVHGKTEFAGGSMIVRGIGRVRELLMPR